MDGLSFEIPGLSFEKCFEFDPIRALLLPLNGLSSCKQGMVGKTQVLWDQQKSDLKIAKKVLVKQK